MTTGQENGLSDDYPAMPSVVGRTHKTSRTTSLSEHSGLDSDASEEERDQLSEDIRKGLFSFRAFVFLGLWYCFSFTTLFLNKYILAYQHGDPFILGAAQMFVCVCCGYTQMRYPCGLYKRIQRERWSHEIWKNVALVGTLRFSTVALGLVALWYVPVSFAETVKSSAPVFTVIISRILLGEQTTWLVNASLLPVMGGLALCSSHELHFNAKGFFASLATNLSECLQNVFSKMLLSGEKYKFVATELQFFTSLSSVWLQLPVLFFLVDFHKFWLSLNTQLFLLYALGGFSFHCQSLTEYMLLGYISPVTHSVANTVKRAVLIWLSVLTFGNEVTFFSALGTIIVFLGVMMYNKAQQFSVTVHVPGLANKQGMHNV